MSWFLDILLIGGAAAMWIFVAGLYIGMSSLALLFAPLARFHRHMVAATIIGFSILAVVLGFVAYDNAKDAIAEMAIHTALSEDANADVLVAMTMERATSVRDLGLGVGGVGLLLVAVGSGLGILRDRSAKRRLGIAG